jgi:hypothetical protein
LAAKTNWPELMIYFKLSDKNTNMKKTISLLCALVLIVGCEQPYYDIPVDQNGKVIIQGVSSTSTNGVSTLDNEFSVTATFATAKAGDVMNVECLQLQTPQSGGTTKQLLPLAGTKKTATVGADLKATITYTRAETNVVNPGDYVTVIFVGETDYAKQKVDLVVATSSTKPKVLGKEVDVARTAETAYFNVTVKPKSSTYAGTLVVTMKNGKKATPVAVPGSPFPNAATFLVPISGTDFAVGKDTMIYSFKATAGSNTDDIPYTVIIRDPYFYLKKTGVTMTLGGSSAGLNILTKSAVSATNANAMLAIDAGSLVIHGGSAWAIGGNSINFVPSTLAVYDKNNSTDAIAAYAAGTPTATLDPIGGTGIYIFKMINGVNPTDVYYGMIKVTAVVPGTSLTLEYRIGDQYAHLNVIS